MKAKPIIITIISVVAVFAVAFGSFFLVDYLFFDEKPTSSSDSKENSDDKSNQDSEDKNDKKVSEDKPSEKVDVVEIENGKTVSVPIKISQNPGFMASVIEINYDTSVLEYTGYRKGDVIKDYTFHEESGKIRFVGCENQDVTKTGTIFYLEFKVKDKNATQTMLTFTDAETAFANSFEKNVSITLNDIKISLK